jgi:tetratricopeptide (TPR) repeat protein
MSPEQVRGDAQLDRRSDLYSMGVTLFRALLDRLPFEADNTADYMNPILSAGPRLAGRRSEIPSDLATILLKSMEKARGDRYADADAFREDIARFRRYEPIRASPPGIGGRLVRWARRKPAAAALTLLLVVGGAVTSALTIQVLRSSRILRGLEVDRLFNDAHYALSTGDFDLALAGFQRVIDLDPGHLLARIDRAMALYESGAGPEGVRRALADLDVVDRLRPGLASARELRRKLAPGAELSEPTASSPSRLAIDDFLLGDLARIEDDCARAVEHYSAALRADPRQPLALLNRGICYRTLGERERAVRDAEVLSRVWPEHSMAHNNLGIALTDTREFDDAFAAFERARALDPESAVIEFNYAIALERADRIGEAEDRLRASLAKRPDFPDARNELGSLLLHGGRLAEAVVEFEEIIRLETAKAAGPDTRSLGRAWTNLCDAQLQRRDLERAQRACRKCLELFPERPNSHYNMALLHMQLGDPDSALAALERDVQLGDRDAAYLEQDRAFLAVRGDPRFHALLTRMRSESP